VDVLKKNERKGSRKKPKKELINERWVWNALDVESRYHLVSYVALRGKDAAVETLRHIKHLTTESPPVFVTDGLPAYGQALLDVYTTPKPPFNASLLRNHFVYDGMGNPLPVVPSELGHLRVIKQRSQKQGGFTSFPTLNAMKAGKEVDLQELVEQIPALTHHTNYVERRNYTQRRRCACLQRKTSAVPQESKDLQAQVTLERFVYNYCRSHRSLRQPHSQAPLLWRKVTPAMKLGVTDHIWTLKEALTISTKQCENSKLPPQAPFTQIFPEPDVVMIQLKDKIDITLLKTLLESPSCRLTRSEICQQTQLPRTTIYDRLCILEAKALVQETSSNDHRRGRPKIYYSCLWERHSFTQSPGSNHYVLVSTTNKD